MKKILFILMIMLFLLFNVVVFATDKGVVVPPGNVSDVNLIPANIKKGVKILGVTGNLGIAWGCRYVPGGNSSRNGSAFDNDCKLAGYDNYDCHVFCSTMSSNLLAISSGETVFCNGNGGHYDKSQLV